MGRSRKRWASFRRDESPEEPPCKQTMTLRMVGRPELMLRGPARVQTDLLPISPLPVLPVLATSSNIYRCDPICWQRARRQASRFQPARPPGVGFGLGGFPESSLSIGGRDCRVRTRPRSPLPGQPVGCPRYFVCASLPPGGWASIRRGTTSASVLPMPSRRRRPRRTPR